MDSIVRKAKFFAEEAHESQKRDGGQPYIIHPEQTALILSTLTDDQELIAAAWLHDVIEDTDVTESELRAEFGDRIADLVMEVTHETKDGKHYFPRLHTKEGIMIKFADRLSNISDMRAWSEKRRLAYLRKSKFWDSSEIELRGEFIDKVEVAKRKATKMFHDDHDLGDSAIYMFKRDMLDLVDELLEGVVGKERAKQIIGDRA